MTTNRHPEQEVFLSRERLSECPELFLVGMAKVVNGSWEPDATSVANARACVEAGRKLEPSVWWPVWESLALSEKPSVGLKFLRETGWVDLFPQLSKLQGIPQSAHWHPEGDVWNHSLEAADVAAVNAAREELSEGETVVAVLGALCHDFGKVTHTQIHADGRITSLDHDVAGVRPAKTFLRSVGASEVLVRQIAVLVRTHMRHIIKDPSLKAVGKLVATLAESGATFEQWCRVAEGDAGGRGPASEHGSTKLWRERFALWQEEQLAPPKQKKERPSDEQIAQWKAEGAARKAARLAAREAERAR